MASGKLINNGTKDTLEYNTIEQTGEPAHGPSTPTKAALDLF
jgi:hypothetical protein